MLLSAAMVTMTRQEFWAQVGLALVVGVVAGLCIMGIARGNRR